MSQLDWSNNMTWKDNPRDQLHLLVGCLCTYAATAQLSVASYSGMALIIELWASVDAANLLSVGWLA